MYRCPNNKNAYSCYAKIIINLLSVIPFLYFGHVYSAWLDFERLLLISGLKDSEELPCMAYIENDIYAITSAECVERILHSREPRSILRLNRQTGKPLLFTLVPDEGITGIRRLRLFSPAPLEVDHLDLFGPPDVFLEPSQSTVDVWYPETGLKRLFFWPTEVLLVNGQQPRIIAPASAPVFASGTPVFERGSMCVLSANGHCFPYSGINKTDAKRKTDSRCREDEHGRVCDNDLTCWRYCQGPCQAMYINFSREPDEFVSAVRCGDETGWEGICNFYNDSSGECLGKPCVIMLNCNDFCSTSDGERFHCKRRETGGVLTTMLVGITSLGLCAAIYQILW